MPVGGWSLWPWEDDGLGLILPLLLILALKHQVGISLQAFIRLIKDPENRIPDVTLP